jgi:arylsulfatase A-like enzyme
LAREGTRFENAVSTTSWTLPAHAAMFTGLQDSVHGLVDNGLRLADGHLTLAEILHREGYDTAGFFVGPYLHPTFGVAQGFDVYESCMTTIADNTGDADVRESARMKFAPSHADVTGPETRKRVARWAQEREGEAPFFLFVHLWDVHYDFIPPAEYVESFSPDYRGSIDGRLIANPDIHPRMAKEDREHVIALYDAEIRFTDDTLAGIVADLEARGMMQNTLFVVTADHGEEFFEHGRKGHNKSLFEEVLRVPLIVHWPGRVAAGRVEATQVQIIDLLPTLATAAGAPGPFAVQGRDLGPLLAGRTLAPKDALSELLIDGARLRALRSNARKIIEMSRGGDAYLFDLESDPEERNPIGPGDTSGAQERRAAQAELGTALERCDSFRAMLGSTEAEALDVNAEIEAQLRALGYLGSDGD